MAKKIKTITNEELARMVKRGFDGTDRRFDAVESRLNKTATKEELAILREDLTILRKDVEAGFQEIIYTLKAIQEEIKYLRGMDAEITALRMRVERLEKKMGI